MKWNDCDVNRTWDIGYFCFEYALLPSGWPLGLGSLKRHCSHGWRLMDMQGSQTTGWQFPLFHKLFRGEVQQNQSGYHSTRSRAHGHPPLSPEVLYWHGWSPSLTQPPATGVRNRTIPFLWGNGPFLWENGSFLWGNGVSLLWQCFKATVQLFSTCTEEWRYIPLYCPW